MGIRKMKEKKGREGASSCFPMSEEELEQEGTGMEALCRAKATRQAKAWTISE